MYATLFLQHMNELPNDKEFGGVYVDASLIHKAHFHFKRIPIYYNDLLVAEWLDDVRYWHDAFQRSAKENVFPRSPHSCQSKFGQCSFINLCRAKPCIKDLPEVTDKITKLEKTLKSMREEKEKMDRGLFEAEQLMI